MNNSNKYKNKMTKKAILFVIQILTLSFTLILAFAAIRIVTIGREPLSTANKRAVLPFLIPQEIKYQKKKWYYYF